MPLLSPLPQTMPFSQPARPGQLQVPQERVGAAGQHSTELWPAASLTTAGSIRTASHTVGRAGPLTAILSTLHVGPDFLRLCSTGVPFPEASLTSPGSKELFASSQNPDTCRPLYTSVHFLLHKWMTFLAFPGTSSVVQRISSLRARQ